MGIFETDADPSPEKPVREAAPVEVVSAAPVVEGRGGGCGTGRD